MPPIGSNEISKILKRDRIYLLFCNFWLPNHKTKACGLGKSWMSRSTYWKYVVLSAYPQQLVEKKNKRKNIYICNPESG